jgi:hypothetical protein
MLVETEGVEVCTPVRGNFEAAKTGVQALRRWMRKADTLAMSTGNLRCCLRRFVGRNRESRSREAAGSRNWPEVVPRKSSGRKRELTGIRNQVRIGTKGRVRSTSRANRQQQLDRLAKAI